MGDRPHVVTFSQVFGGVDVETHLRYSGTIRYAVEISWPYINETRPIETMLPHAFRACDPALQAVADHVDGARGWIVNKHAVRRLDRVKTDERVSDRKAVKIPYGHLLDGTDDQVGRRHPVPQSVFI